MYLLLFLQIDQDRELPFSVSRCSLSLCCRCCRYGMASRQDSQVDGKYNPAPPAGYRPELNRADSNRSGLGRGVGVMRGPESKPAYPSDRYNPPAPANNTGRYPDQGQQRGYPVGRDNIHQPQAIRGQLDRQTSNPYPPSQQNNLNRPHGDQLPARPQYNGPPSMTSSYQAPGSAPQYNGPSSRSASYQQPPSGTTTQYNNTKPISKQPNAPSYNSAPSSYSNNNTGYNPPPVSGSYNAPPASGSYNAGAMNRQTNQQMYNFYDANEAPKQTNERQPPIGQNSFDSRGGPSQPAYQSSYNPRPNAPSTYKTMDYGPQGMIRNSSSSTASNPRTMYSGQGGPPRPSFTNNNYNDQQMNNNYYSRQPTYQ